MPFPSPVHESESEVAQSCPTLLDPMDCSLPGSSIHGIFQASVLEWVTISSPRGSPVLRVEPLSLASPAREMQLSGGFFTTALCRKICMHTSPLFLNFLPI